ncbi:sensor histidine kinase [Cohnella faecalis]|nr:sensor histidine kinase [Cohnella faecalis]
MAFGILLTGCSFKEEPRSYPKAQNGRLDLTDWSWEKGGIMPLDGEWSFEWHESRSADAREMKIEVPGMWGAMRDDRHPGLKDQGFGIYRLTLVHLPTYEIMAIRLPNISTAYSLIINGYRVMTKGIPGMEAEETIPSQKPEIVFYMTKGRQTDIEIRVANFDHRNGGIRTPIILGKAKQIEKLQASHSRMEFIVFGSLCMIGIYHLGLYLLRRKEGTNLFLALLCLFVALRAGLIGEGVIVQWFPFIDWQIATKLEYIAFAAAGWSGFAFLGHMFPREFGKRWLQASNALVLSLSVFTAVLPTLWFTSCLVVFQLYALVFGLRALIGLIASTFRNREGAKLALIGMAGFLLTIVNDILFYNGWWRSLDLVPFGLLFLIVMNAFIISIRSSRTFERAEHLSAELKEWNDRLEGRIAERTEELRHSYMTLEEAKIGLERMEQSRRHLVSNISHDLRTPITLLQGYLEALRDGVIDEPERRDATIRLMLGKVEGLGRLIQDLFELSVLEARRVELSLETITLGEWTERLAEQYGLEMPESEVDFRCETASLDAASATVSVDVHRMDRVFANLIYNAVRYTPKGGTIAVKFDMEEDGSHALISLSDNGSGIHPDDLPHIFDRFYKKDKSRHSSSGGSGLGLSITKEIVELHGGVITVVNLPEGGSEFRIRLPIAAV